MVLALVRQEFWGGCTSILVNSLEVCRALKQRMMYLPEQRLISAKEGKNAEEGVFGFTSLIRKQIKSSSQSQLSILESLYINKAFALLLTQTPKVHCHLFLCGLYQ